jgi:hypothetical protein
MKGMTMKSQYKVVIAILAACLLVFAYLTMNSLEESVYTPVHKELSQGDAVFKAQTFMDHLGSEMESDADNVHSWTKNYPAITDLLNKFSHELNLFGRKMGNVTRMEQHLKNCKFKIMTKGYSLTCNKETIFHLIDAGGEPGTMGTFKTIMKFNFDIGGELTYWLPLPSVDKYTTPMDEPWFKYASAK